MNKHEKKYGDWHGDHPHYVLADWQYEVANNDSRLGYWEWVASQAQQDAEIEKTRQDVGRPLPGPKEQSLDDWNAYWEKLR